MAGGAVHRPGGLLGEALVVPLEANTVVVHFGEPMDPAQDLLGKQGVPYPGRPHSLVALPPLFGDPQPLEGVLADLRGPEAKGNPQVLGNGGGDRLPVGGLKGFEEELAGWLLHPGPAPEGGGPGGV